MLTTFFREEHEIFRKTLRDWVQQELAPHADAWEKAELFPREIFSISRQWRDARLITIGGGTSEIMKEILSKRLGWG